MKPTPVDGTGDELARFGGSLHQDTRRSQMFHLYEIQPQTSAQPIAFPVDADDDFVLRNNESRNVELGSDDIDFVDDTLLNTAPHNKIEAQLLRGDVVGLALMSSAIIWSAMGAFG